VNQTWEERLAFNEWVLFCRKARSFALRLKQRSAAGLARARFAGNVVLILARLLHVVDNNDPHGPFSRFEPQPQLLAERLENCGA
jgi:hypothetical protein